MVVSADFSCLAHIESGDRGGGRAARDVDDRRTIGEGAGMSGYRERSAAEIREQRPSTTLTPMTRKLVDDSAAMLGRGPGDAKLRAAAARAYAVEHLEELHAQVREQFARRGIGYHRAATAEEAVAIMLRLLAGAKRVAKSKTMVGEEVGLTHALRSAGIDLLGDGYRRVHRGYRGARAEPHHGAGHPPEPVADSRRC